MGEGRSGESKVTIKTVAKRAGTSIATVSRVIHDNYPVSDDLRAKINHVIQETGYRPNAVAASIRTRRSMTVGMVVSKFNNPLVMQTVLGVESVLEKEGYQLIISSSNNELVKEKTILESLRERMVDALVAVSVSRDDKVFEPFFADRIPVVIVDRSIPSERMDMVVNDDRLATAKLTGYVIAKGHVRIAVLKGIDSIVIGHERTTGYLEAMEQAGMPLIPEFQLEGEFQREKAYEKMMALLKSMPRDKFPTAVVACNTLMAEGAMQAIYEMGLKIPSDISLACYGVLSRSPVFRPRIVCGDQRSEEIGVAAGNLVLERMKGSTNASVKQVIEARFVEGDSVKKIM